MATCTQWMPNIITMSHYLNAPHTVTLDTGCSGEWRMHRTATCWSILVLFFSSNNLNYFAAGFRLGRRPLQNAPCNFFATHYLRPLSPPSSTSLLPSPPPNAVCKFNKYIDTFSEFVFVHRVEFRITFFWSVSAFAFHASHTIDARVEKSNIFSWLKINWMNLSQLYCAREVRADTRSLAPEYELFLFSACARARP